MKTNVIVKFDLEGQHSWPMAPSEYEVLRNPHGHIFHFEVHQPVKSDDRGIEFLEFRRYLLGRMELMYYNRNLGYCNFGSNSCEMLAKHIVQVLEDSRKYGPPNRVAVFEDNFVGAEVIL